MIPEVPWWARQFRPRKRPEPLSPLEIVVLAILGVVMVALVVVFAVVPLVAKDVADQGLDERGTRVVGVVDDIDTRPDSKYDWMTYHYTVDGRTYHGSATYDAEPMVGRDIKLFYDPENPGNSRVDLSNPAYGRPESEKEQEAQEHLWGFAIFVVLTLLVWLWFLRGRSWWIKRRRTPRRGT